MSHTTPIQSPIPVLIPFQGTTITLASVVAKVESNDNGYALRYEPAWRVSNGSVSRIATINECTRDTARVLGAISWGRYQIMGSNLYDAGLTVPVGGYLNDDVLQQQYFISFLDRNDINFSIVDILDDDQKAHRFGLRYNGAPGPYLVAIRDTFDRLMGR